MEIIRNVILSFNRMIVAAIMAVLVYIFGYLGLTEGYAELLKQVQEHIESILAIFVTPITFAIMNFLERQFGWKILVFNKPGDVK